MFTDIAGYTALSAKDETKALKLLDTQKHILTPIIEEFNGTLHKEMGDGLLFTFPTVTEAVKCGIKIQEKTKANDDLNLRVGIHEGEITLKDGDALGDDVNVASRIEAFAPSGGIAISSKVQQNISSLPEFETSYIGRPELKGVAQEVKVYCITSHGIPRADEIVEPIIKESKSNFNVFALTGGILTAIGVAFWIAVGVFDVSFGGKAAVPSIGILMMENLGGVDEEYWARGITEDLIIKVAGAGLIRVAPMKEILEVDIKDSFEKIAKKLRVKYILTSSIYKKEEGFDLRCQLIEAESGNSKYANKWSESIDNAPTIVGNLAENILNSLKVSTKQEITKVPTSNTAAYEYYLKAKYKFEKRENKEDTEIARGLLHRAIELDDNLIIAKHLLGNSYMSVLGEGEYDKAFEIYKDNLNQAEEIGDKRGMAMSLYRLAMFYSDKGNIEKAEDYQARSLRISEELGDRAGIASTLRSLGWSSFEKDDFDSALDFFSRALKIQEDIDDKWEMRFTLYSFGSLYSRKGDYEKSLNYFTRTLEIRKEIGDKWGIGNALGEIGFINYIKGDIDKALHYFTSALKIHEELGDNVRKAIVNIFIGISHFHQGDYKKAVDNIEPSLPIVKISFGEKELSIWFPASIYLFLSFKNLDREYDLDEIHYIIKIIETSEINDDIIKDRFGSHGDMNYRLYQLLEDISYLEKAYNQVQDKASAMDEELGKKFLSYPIPKAIVEEWEKVK
jgi:tetratricopeptide (TPR) repeat protein